MKNQNAFKEMTNRQNLEQNPEGKICAQLSSDLSLFGLCPFDWTIEIKSQETAMIKNKKESDFCFIGQINQDRTWKKIQLHSL